MPTWNFVSSELVNTVAMLLVMLVFQSLSENDDALYISVDTHVAVEDESQSTYAVTDGTWEARHQGRGGCSPVPPVMCTFAVFVCVSV